MFIHVTGVEYVEGYTLNLTFNNGVSGWVDLQSELYGEMFEPLLDLDLFKSFKLDEEIDTVVWSNGADFAPEFLLEKLNSQNLKIAEGSVEYRTDLKKNA